MKAFVLSGGGNYGALQAGALEVLLDRGIQPDILVGVSAGALNAAFLAVDPTITHAQRLEDIWRYSAPEFFMPINYWKVARRLIWNQDGLISNDCMQRFIRAWMPASFSTFGDVEKCSLYVIASRLADGAMRVFGEKETDPLFDALMASAALSPLFPPWSVEGKAYVDGGVSTVLPILTAVQHGADEIYALHVNTSPPHVYQMTPHGVVGIGSRVLSTLINRSAEYEIDIMRQHPRVSFHLIRLFPSNDPGFWNFTQGAELIRDGRRQAEEQLASAPVLKPWHYAAYRRVRQIFKAPSTTNAPFASV